MLKTIHVLFVLFVFLLCGCVKETEEGGMKNTKQSQIFCSTEKDPDLISKTRFQIPSMTKQDVEGYVDMHLKAVEQGKSYMVLSLDKDTKDLIIMVYNFNSERKDLKVYEQPKAVANKADLRTIGSGTATAVNRAYGILWWDIKNNPHLYAPCEQELTIVEWDGMYYLEDCC